MPPLPSNQRAFLEAVARLCAERATGGVFTVASDYLGYLPFGLSVWVEVAGEPVNDACFAEPWDSGDVEALAKAGLLEQLERQVLDDDGFDLRTTYRLMGPPPR